MTHPILFFDGCCPLCNFFVRMIYRLDRKAVLRFAPIESEIGRTALERHPFLKKIDSAFLIDQDERVAIESEMAAHLTDYLKWPQKLFLLPFKIIPRWIGNPLYKFVAKNRTTVFGRYEVCPYLSEDMKDRILTQ